MEAFNEVIDTLILLQGKTKFKNKKSKPKECVICGNLIFDSEKDYCSFS